MSDNSLEAKIVILGSQGVGKTSLLHRYVKNTWSPSTIHSTIGASFLTKRVFDSTSDTTIRLQLWDTAGQERFRTLQPLYYRGAQAAILVYDITSEKSFFEMTGWLQELKRNMESDVILHVVGTKSDMVAADPSLRAVPFERCIAYVAEHLYPAQASTPPASASGTQFSTLTASFNPPKLLFGPSPHASNTTILYSPDSKRSSGFWGQDVGWDSCHEISAKDGEGVDELFRVLARKLVEQQKNKNKLLAIEREAVMSQAGMMPISGGDGIRDGGYSDGPITDGNLSFRVGHGDKRKSWLGFPSLPSGGDETSVEPVVRRKGGCC
ncbi:MAG: hypothetical protein M1834_006636 [Cirrosporium novae-zelandiae]|nr:MAG: hypothetical protein M1834_006636 [Cirrosporium novae-zelandiae]